MRSVEREQASVKQLRSSRSWAFRSLTIESFQHVASPQGGMENCWEVLGLSCALKHPAPLALALPETLSTKLSSMRLYPLLKKNLIEILFVVLTLLHPEVAQSCN